MIKNSLVIIIFAVTFCFAGVTLANAQNGEQPFAQEESRIGGNALLRSLDLSNEQKQQLRRINLEWGSRLKEAQRRFKNAQRELNEAIYSEDFNEALIQVKVDELQSAHSELIRTRTNMQTSIRRVLNRDQLAKFRQIRQESERSNAVNNPKIPDGIRRVQNQPPIPLHRPALGPNARPIVRP